jgi:hypothetical protein
LRVELTSDTYGWQKKVKSELIVFSPAYPQFKNKSGQADMLLRVNKNKFPDLFSA